MTCGEIRTVAGYFWNCALAEGHEDGHYFKRTHPSEDMSPNHFVRKGKNVLLLKVADGIWVRPELIEAFIYTENFPERNYKIKIKLKGSDKWIYGLTEMTEIEYLNYLSQHL